MTEEIPAPQRDRIIEALEEIEDDLEEIAAADVAFAADAENALDWLDRATDTEGSEGVLADA